MKREQLMMVLFEKRLQEEKEFLMRKGRDFFTIMIKINKITKLTEISEGILQNILKKFLDKVVHIPPKKGKKI